MYDAALNPLRWRDVLAKLAPTVGCESTMLFRLVGSEDPVIPAALDPTDGGASGWSGFIDSFSEWKRALWSEPPGVSTLDDVVPERDLLRSTLYRGWMRPQQLRWCVQVVASDEDRERLVLAMFRHPGQTPFQTHEKAALASIAPCLEDCLRIRRRVERVELQRDIAFEALEQIPLGVILLDRSGRPLHANRHAARILGEGDGLSSEWDGLRAGSGDESRALRQALTDVAAGDRASLEVLGISRPSGRRPLSVLLAGVASPATGDAGNRPAAVVYLGDPERRNRVPEALLRTLYDLTPAEARIAGMLAEGSSLREISDALRLSRHTVRNQLKGVFLKTGTNRQGELISHLLSSAAVAGASMSPRDSTLF